MYHNLLLGAGWVLLLVVLIAIVLVVLWLLRVSKISAAVAIALPLVLGLLEASFALRIDVRSAVPGAESPPCVRATRCPFGVTAPRFGGTPVVDPMSEGIHAKGDGG